MFGVVNRKFWQLLKLLRNLNTPMSYCIIPYRFSMVTEFTLTFTVYFDNFHYSVDGWLESTPKYKYLNKL